MKTKSKSNKTKALRVEPTNKVNPFEVHINRSKHQVLGRKLKSDYGLPGISKNKALQKRKTVLLQEYKMKDKINFFHDQRIGEKNTSMTEDDRIMARFAAERMRAFNKKQMFNLSDSEVLTHKGQMLSEIEKFEDVRSDDEDDDEENNLHRSGHLKGKFVESAHFGGGMLTKSNQDRESLIDQLINESKKRKAERQRNKEETLEATEQLDEDWKMMANIITSNSKEDTHQGEPKEKQKSDQYDLVMRQLKFEPQAKATQRIKSNEEIAKEDKEELERLESERLKQLRETEHWQGGGRHRSADDLDDGFEYHVEDVKEGDSGEESESDSERQGVGSIEKEVAEGDEEGDESESEEAEGEGSEAEEAEGGGSESEDSEGEDAMDNLSDLMPAGVEGGDERGKAGGWREEMVKTREGGDGGGGGQPKPEAEPDLPFVIDVPENAEALAAMVLGRPARHRDVLFTRILKTNHPSLNPANKSKMLTLCEQLIQLIKGGDERMGVREALALGGEWTMLARWNAADCLAGFANCVADNADNVQSRVATCVSGAAWWPSAARPTLGQFAAQLLSSSSALPLRLVCCYALLQDAKRTCALYPEAISCLATCLKTVGEISSSPLASSSGKRDNVEDELKILLTDLDDNEQQPTDEQTLYVASILLADFVKIYRVFPHSKLLFKSVSDNISLIKTENHPKRLKEAVSELKKALAAVEATELAPLARAAEKPKALRLYEPSWSVVREGDRGSRRLPADTIAHQKLVRRHRHETKGALRELRRDRQFLASVKLRQTARSDEQRMKKVKEIFGSAASQQGELRKLKRNK